MKATKPELLAQGRTLVLRALVQQERPPKLRARASSLRRGVRAEHLMEVTFHNPSATTFHTIKVFAVSGQSSFLTYAVKSKLRYDVLRYQCSSA